MTVFMYMQQIGVYVQHAFICAYIHAMSTKLEVHHKQPPSTMALFWGSWAHCGALTLFERALPVLVGRRLQVAVMFLRGPWIETKPGSPGCVPQSNGLHLRQLRVALWYVYKDPRVMIWSPIYNPAIHGAFRLQIVERTRHKRQMPQVFM